ncbi:MAG TPA: ion channel [Terriglobia bacterium]
MTTVISDRHSLFLLVSLLTYILLIPFLEGNRIGEVILLVSIFTTLLAAAVLLSAAATSQWPAILLAVSCLLATAAVHFYPIRLIVIAQGALLIGFFGFLSVGLFSYLGQGGSVTSGRLYASVSLYLMLAVFWMTIYRLIDVVYPGSFALTGGPSPLQVPHHAYLYFSLVTLTTLGYGDIVPISPVARIFAALEAATGVFYVAITVARLVAGYERPPRKEH